MTEIPSDQALAQIADQAVTVWERVEPPNWLREYAALARAAASDFVTVPSSLRGKPGAILGVMMAGRELSLQPMQSLRLIDVINGVPTLRTELKVSFYRKAGHKLEVVERRTGELIRLRGTRADSGEQHEVCWTLAGAVGDEVAVPMELRRKSNWENYPDQMLWARCASQLIRELAPEVTGANFYSTEEIEPPEPPENPHDGSLYQ